MLAFVISAIKAEYILKYKIQKKKLFGEHNNQGAFKITEVDIVANSVRNGLK